MEQLNKIYIKRNRHDMLLGVKQNTTKPFPNIMGGGEGNLAEYFTKHRLIWHHITMQPIFLKPTRKYIENSKYRRTGTGRGCDGTINPGVTYKLDNLLKIIHNLVPNGTRNQWPRGLSVPT